MLKYRIISAIINDSLAKRTMKVVNSRFLIMSESARRMMVSNKLETYTKDSHKLWSMMMVFLGIFDFSNGEGGSSIRKAERACRC